MTLPKAFCQSSRTARSDVCIALSRHRVFADLVFEGNRSLWPILVVRGAHFSSRSRTCLRPTGSRSRAPIAATRGARPTPHDGTCVRYSGSRSHATTAAPRDAHPLPPPRTSMRPTADRPRATPSTPRDVHPSPLRDKGILVDNHTVDLPVAPVAGAAARLNIRGARLGIHLAPQT